MYWYLIEYTYINIFFRSNSRYLTQSLLVVTPWQELQLPFVIGVDMYFTSPLTPVTEG